MITLTNSFHNTKITIRAKVGDTVSRSTLRRAHKALCGISDCLCGHEDGTRDSRYRLERQGLGAEAPIWVIDTRAEEDALKTAMKHAMLALPVRVLARWNKEDWDDDRMVATRYRYYDADSGDEIELTEEQASQYSWGQTEDNITGGSQAGSLQ